MKSRFRCSIRRRASRRSGRRNGGATSPGVTADTIKIGYYIAKPDPIFDTLAKQPARTTRPKPPSRRSRSTSSSTGASTTSRAARSSSCASTARARAATPSPRAPTPIARPRKACSQSSADRRKRSSSPTNSRPRRSSASVRASSPSRRSTTSTTSPTCTRSVRRPTRRRRWCRELIKNQLARQARVSVGGSDVNGKPRTFTLLTYNTPDGQFKSSWDDLEKKMKATGANVVGHVDYYLNFPTLAGRRPHNRRQVCSRRARRHHLHWRPDFPEVPHAGDDEAELLPRMGDVGNRARRHGRVRAELRPATVEARVRAAAHPGPPRAGRSRTRTPSTSGGTGPTPPTDNNYGVVKGDVELLMDRLADRGAEAHARVVQGGPRRGAAERCRHSNADARPSRRTAITACGRTRPTTRPASTTPASCAGTPP